MHNNCQYTADANVGKVHFKFSKLQINLTNMAVPVSNPDFASLDQPYPTGCNFQWPIVDADCNYLCASAAALSQAKWASMVHCIYPPMKSARANLEGTSFEFDTNANQVVKREELTKKVWEDNGVIVGRSLDTYISKLRKKLQQDETIKLTNVHGIGYKLEIKS